MPERRRRMDTTHNHEVHRHAVAEVIQNNEDYAIPQPEAEEPLQHQEEMMNRSDNLSEISRY